MMRKVAALAFVCSTAIVAPSPAFAQAPAPAPAPDCVLKKLGEIPLTISGNTVTAPITLNGVRKTMTLELSEGPSFITYKVGKGLDLTFRDMPDPNMLGYWHYVRLQGVAYASNMQFGPISAARSQFFVIPDPRWQFADGIIGSGILSVVDYDLDVGGGKITLFDPNHCPGQVVYWTTSTPASAPMHIDAQGGHFHAAMSLDGKPLSVALRTDGPSYMTWQTLRMLFGKQDRASLREVPNTLFEAGHRFQSAKVYEYPFKSLTASGITIDNPKIFVVDDVLTGAGDGHFHLRCPLNASCYDHFDMYLGLPLLSKLRIFVSSKEKMLYITPR